MAVEQKEKMVKKQHYVPRFYLNFFTDEKERLNVYDFIKSQFIYSKPKDICMEKYLYETEWENADKRLGRYILPNRIENSYRILERDSAEVLRKIIKKSELDNKNISNVCSKKEKQVLFGFIANLFVRNLHTINEIEMNDISDVIDNDDIKPYIQLFEKIGWGGGESFIRAVSKDCYLNPEIENGFYNNVYNNIKDLKYMFYKSEKDIFVTSDFPVMIGTDNTIKTNNKLTIAFPISPRVFLIIGNFPKVKKFSNCMVAVKESEAFMLSCHYVNSNSQRCRFVISSSEQMLKKILGFKE